VSLEDSISSLSLFPSRQQPHVRSPLGGWVGDEGCALVGDCVRNVISGSSDRENDPIRVLIGDVCRVW
jgi:hypothetical protein